MKDSDKTKRQLLKELEALKREVKELEAGEARHKREEEALRKFKTISDRAGHGIVMRDLEGRFIYVNEAFARMHGYEQKEMLGKHLSIAHTREQLEHIERVRGQSGEGYIAEIWHKRRDGTIFPTLMTGSTIKDEKGNPLYLSATAIDITELKQTEEALREQIRRNELILQTAMDGFFIMDVRGKIIEANQAATMISGYSKEQLVGMDIRDFEILEDPNETPDHIKKVMKEGSNRFETRNRRKDGRVVDLEVSTNFIQIGKEKLFFSFFRDITERKKAYQALKERDRELRIKTINLEETNTALKVLLKRREDDKRELEDKVLSNMNELVLPYIERLKKSRLDQRQKAYVNILESNVNDVISSFSYKLSSKFLGLTPTEIQIANLIKEGKRTKDIADLLNLSYKTIETHRKNVRRKLGIINKKANLRTYLLSLQ